MSDNLVFSSVGDEVIDGRPWARRTDDYDTLVVHYGDDDLVLEEYLYQVCQRAYSRKGPKFENLRAVYESMPAESGKAVADYEYVFVVDDDIVMPEEDVKACFKRMKELNLQVGSPAHYDTGRFSHPHMIPQGNGERLTNFVEMTAMFLHRDILRKLMLSYDAYCGTLIDVGIDHVIATFVETPMVIFDWCPILNPERPKGGMKALGGVEYRTSLWTETHRRKPELHYFRKPWTWRLDSTRIL